MGWAKREPYGLGAHVAHPTILHNLFLGVPLYRDAINCVFFIPITLNPKVLIFAEAIAILSPIIASMETRHTLRCIHF
ncbi:hypothetical protein [Nostoc sp. C052]|uniref:hypothetical protein n=1 Tax=Nostoc sp. C052 TaxID=2576902 RepID=UPI0015C3B61C|nr:hypothetical protein [Nostoc sp. C052]